MLKKNSILFFLSILFSTNLFAVDCKTFKTKIIDNKKAIIRSERLCIRHDEKATTASSVNCVMADDVKCPFHSFKKGSGLKTLVSERGSPGFNLCTSVEGRAQMYQIEVAGKWKPFERCFAKNSQEFLDIRFLILYTDSLN